MFKLLSNKDGEDLLRKDSIAKFNKAYNSLSIIGCQSSGKSTLLNIVGLLDDPDSGSFIFNGIE